ncbi:hypothetical protein [Gordonia hydrophobica]|uniref:Uncharacterized protein n=1 Tax=Gordonia hydrophobica TaxID=40516 RepID=A0ABZ2TY00_9ACTN|nr:hypothetical protein [Gordonia hydrophobica]MBM7366535.1 hypothetical protein [Gordonia hydrophobica]
MNYYMLDDVVGAKVSRTKRNYLLFRFGPVLIVSVLAFSHLDDRPGERFLIAALIGVGHVAISVWRLNPLMRGSGNRGRRWYLYQILVLIASFVAIAFAFLVEWILGEVLPTWSDYFAAVVTAMLVVVIGGAIRATTSTGPGVGSADIDEYEAKYKRIVDEVALAYGVDRSFANALIACEEFQRPSWFRKLEFRLAWSRSIRTFGLGQSSVDPESSIKEQIAAVLAGMGDLRDPGTGHLSSNRMRAAAESINEGDGYVEFVMSVYYSIQSGVNTCNAIGPDGNPLVVCGRSLLDRGKWKIEGDCYAGISGVELVLAQSIYDVEWLPSNIPGRKAWRCRLPIDASSVVVRVENSSASHVVDRPYPREDFAIQVGIY